MTVRRLEDGGERNAMMGIKCRIRDRIGDAACYKRNNWVMPRLEWRGIVSGWRPLIYVIGGAMERVRGESVFNKVPVLLLPCNSTQSSGRGTLVRIPTFIVA